jgi:hypothetical protein
MKKHWTGLLLLTICLCWGAATADAQQADQAKTNAVRQSCRGDYQSYCSDVPPGGKASLQCLQDHTANLSPACQSALAAMSGAGNTGRAASGSQSGNAPASSQTPNSARGAEAPQMREEAAMMRRACGRDFRMWCHGVPLGGGQGLACLEQNQTNLSPGCQNALSQIQASR